MNMIRHMIRHMVREIRNQFLFKTLIIPGGAEARFVRMDRKRLNEICANRPGWHWHYGMRYKLAAKASGC